MSRMIIGRIIYLALKQISVSYLALKNLNFLIWHIIEIYFRKWHYRPFRTVTVSSDWQNNMNTLSRCRNPRCQIGKFRYFRGSEWQRLAGALLLLGGASRELGARERESREDQEEAARLRRRCHPSPTLKLAPACCCAANGREGSE